MTSIASGASADDIAPVISEDETLMNAEFQRRHWVDRTVEDRWFETFAAMREKEVSRPFFHFDSFHQPRLTMNEPVSSLNLQLLFEGDSNFR